MRGAMSSTTPTASQQDKASSQSSKLLPSLFERVDEEQRLSVLHIGPALPDTVDFFAAYRCKLHFVDLFGELPLVDIADEEPTLQQRLDDLLQFPQGTQFDICLFWDLFNFINRDAIRVLLAALRPYLKANALAHAFAAHNLKTPTNSYVYGIRHNDEISLRNRPAQLAEYAPHSQGDLKQLLYYFNFERSVLLADSRLELLLRARL